MKGQQTLVKFLIDECLIKRLEPLAVGQFYVQSKHVKHLGMLGRKDFNLMSTILDDDWTFVTWNARDFRQEPSSLSTRPMYEGVEKLRVRQRTYPENGD